MLKTKERVGTLWLSKGFTLIELLIVVAIIAILASSTLVALRGASERAHLVNTLRFSSQIQRTLGADAVGIWTFDDCGEEGNVPTTLADTSGYGNHGTNFGAVCREDTPHRMVGTGAGRRSLSFDGVGNRVGVASAPSLNTPSITVEGWFNLSSRGAGRHVLITNWLGYSLEIHSDGRPYFRLNGISPMDTFSLTPIAWNQWYHIVATFDNANKQVTIYLNGANTRTATVAGSIVYGTPPTVRIGWNNELTGLIDEVRIYNRALTANQIQAKYYAGLERLLARGLIDREEHQQRLLASRD